MEEGDAGKEWEALQPDFDLRSEPVTSVKAVEWALRVQHAALDQILSMASLQLQHQSLPFPLVQQLENVMAWAHNSTRPKGVYCATDEAYFTKEALIRTDVVAKEAELAALCRDTPSKVRLVSRLPHIRSLQQEWRQSLLQLVRYTGSPPWLSSCPSDVVALGREEVSLICSRACLVDEQHGRDEAFGSILEEFQTRFVEPAAGDVKRIRGILATHKKMKEAHDSRRAQLWHFHVSLQKQLDEEFHNRKRPRDVDVPIPQDERLATEQARYKALLEFLNLTERILEVRGCTPMISITDLQGAAKAEEVPFMKPKIITPSMAVVYATFRDALERSYSLKFVSLLHTVPHKPDTFKGNLMEYQIKALCWMQQAYHFHTHIVFADDPGLGKAVVVLCYMAMRKADPLTKDRGPFLFIVTEERFLVWQQLCLKYVPALASQFAALSSAVPDEQKLVIINKMKTRNTRPQALFTTPELLMKHRAVLGKVPFDSIILDHRLQSISGDPGYNSELIKVLSNFTSMMRILLISTAPHAALNTLWSIWRFLCPRGKTVHQWYFETDPKRPPLTDPVAHFMAWIGEKIEEFGGKPKERVVLDKEEEHFVVRRLAQALSPFIFRRRRSDVPPEELPVIIQVTITCKLSWMQSRLYWAFAHWAEEEVLRHADTIDPMVFRRAVVAYTALIRRVLSHPFLLFKFSKDTEAWHLPSVQGDRARHQELFISSCGKLSVLHSVLKVLRQRLRPNQSHKIVIYTQEPDACGILLRYLKTCGPEPLVVSATMTKVARVRQMERFAVQEPGMQILLLNLPPAAFNLSVVDTLLIYDSETSAERISLLVGRCRHVGDSFALRVVKLVSVLHPKTDLKEGTVEELLEHVQEVWCSSPTPSSTQPELLRFALRDRYRDAVMKLLENHLKYVAAHCRDVAADSTGYTLADLSRMLHLTPVGGEEPPLVEEGVQRLAMVADCPRAMQDPNGGMILARLCSSLLCPRILISPRNVDETRQDDIFGLLCGDCEVLRVYDGDAEEATLKAYYVLSSGRGEWRSKSVDEIVEVAARDKLAPSPRCLRIAQRVLKEYEVEAGSTFSMPLSMLVGYCKKYNIELEFLVESTNPYLEDLPV